MVLWQWRWGEKIGVWWVWVNERSEVLVRGFIILESLLIESLLEFQLRSIEIYVLKKQNWIWDIFKLFDQQLMCLMHFNKFNGLHKVLELNVYFFMLKPGSFEFKWNKLKFETYFKNLIIKICIFCWFLKIFRFLLCSLFAICNFNVNAWNSIEKEITWNMKHPWRFLKTNKILLITKHIFYFTCCSMLQCPYFFSIL